MPMPFQLTSPRFQNGETIPITYACEGENIPPPLHWEGEPPGTRSFALIVEDPDAPDPSNPKTPWVHWVLYNLPPNFHDIPESLMPESIPESARQGLNDWKKQGYGGPCPPVGKHRYVYHLYALDTVLPDLGRVTRAQLASAMDGHVLAETTLVGLYEKFNKMHHHH